MSKKPKRERLKGAADARETGPSIAAEQLAPLRPGHSKAAPVPVTVPFLVAGTLILVAAALLRLSAAANCLWFDEVWSVRFAEVQSSPWEIFYALNHSNNNHLNTLYLYFLGGTSTNWILYRLPAIIAGVGTVFLAGRIALSEGRGAALLAMLLTAFSYPLIHYASEARGYGTALFFDLLAFDCLRRFLDSGRAQFAVGFWIGCIGSLLSHLMFLSLYPAIVLWSIAAERRAGLRWLDVARLTVRLNVIPAGAIAILYLLDIQHMVIGGAPDYSLVDVLASALSLTVGGPVSGPAAEMAAIVCLLLFVAGLIVVYRSGSREWLFYLLAVVVMPGLLLLVERPQALFVRYFLASILFMLVLLPRTLTAAWTRGNAGHGVVALLLAGFLIGNARQTIELLQVGRGDYLADVQFMADQSGGPIVGIDSDHHDRNTMLLGFYQRFVGPNKFIVHVPPNMTIPEPTEWFIMHRLPGERPPEREITVRGSKYLLVRHDRSCALSGWDWFIYHIVNPAD